MAYIDQVIRNDFVVIFLMIAVIFVMLAKAKWG